MKPALEIIATVTAIAAITWTITVARHQTAAREHNLMAPAEAERAATTTAMNKLADHIRKSQPAPYRNEAVTRELERLDAQDEADWRQKHHLPAKLQTENSAAR